MPCWVAPVVAAELWGVSLEHVLGAIADGSIPSRHEYGFELVDVAPSGTVPTPRRRDGTPPRTYVVVDEPEAEAPELPVAVPWEQGVPGPTCDVVEQWLVPDLTGHMFPEQAPPPIPAIVPEVEDPELPPLDDEEDDKPIGNWRQVRSNVGRMRKPPVRTPPPAAAFAA
jgi:hypothetical protein